MFARPYDIVRGGHAHAGAGVRVPWLTFGVLHESHWTEVAVQRLADLRDRFVAAFG